MLSERHLNVSNDFQCYSLCTLQLNFSFIKQAYALNKLHLFSRTQHRFILIQIMLLHV